MHSHSKTPLILTASVSLAVLVAACGGGSANESSDSANQKANDSKSGTIVGANYGGVTGTNVKKNLAAPFTKETGIKVTQVESGVGFVAKLKAQRQAGKMTWSTIEGIGSNEYSLLARQGYFAPIPPDMRKEIKKQSYPGTVKKYGIALGNTGIIIACNMKLVEKCPKNPEEFWDVKNFPGSRGMINNAYEMMASALVADGVPTESIFPLDIDRAFKKLKEIKPHVSVWATSGDQQVQILRDKQVGMSLIWNGRAKSVEDQGVPLTMHWDGSLVSPNYMVVIKDGPNEAAAMKYLKWYATHPKAQANMERVLPYGGNNKHISKYLTKEEEALLPSSPKNSQRQVQMDGDWWVDNASKVEPRWKQFIAG